MINEHYLTVLAGLFLLIAYFLCEFLNVSIWVFPAVFLVMVIVLLVSHLLIDRNPAPETSCDASDHAHPHLVADSGNDFDDPDTLPAAAETYVLKSDVQKELAMARTVQQGLLAVENPDIPGLDVACACIPADNVGGDFYTFVQKNLTSFTPRASLPGVVDYVDKEDLYLGVIIGDVAGHGISSALVMALCSGLLRELGHRFRSPARLFREANNEVARYITNSQVSYLTAFYGLFNPQTLELVFAKAGHPPALLIRQNGAVESLDAGGVFLGMFEDEEYEEKRVQLAPGDKVLFYTDGLTEAKSPDGLLFGEEALITLLTQNHHLGAADLKTAIYAAVSAWSNNGPLADDQTLVIVEAKGT